MTDQTTTTVRIEIIFFEFCSVIGTNYSQVEFFLGKNISL